MLSGRRLCFAISTLVILALLFSSITAVALAQPVDSATLAPGETIPGQTYDSDPDLITRLPIQDWKLLQIVTSSAEFQAIESRLVSSEPIDSWPVEKFTILTFDLQPLASPLNAGIDLYPVAFFMANETGVASTVVATPDLSTMQMDIQDLKNPGVSRVVPIPKDVARELLIAEARARRRSSERGQSPDGPCGWICTEIVHHPGHMDQGCLNNCANWVCGGLSWGFYQICYAGCSAACWVPGWDECVQWEWVCGLP